MLRQLGVQEAAGGLAAAAAAEQHAAQPTARSRGPPRPRERRPALPAAVLPARKSARQRGDRPLTQEEAVAAAATELGAAAVPDLSQATDKELGGGGLRDWLLARQTFCWPSRLCSAGLPGSPPHPARLPRCCLPAEHGALLDLEQYFKLIGQDISEAVHTGGCRRSRQCSINCQCMSLHLPLLGVHTACCLLPPLQTAGSTAG